MKVEVSKFMTLSEVAETLKSIHLPHLNISIYREAPDNTR